MHRNHIVPLLLRHIEHHPVAQNPGTAHHNVQPPEIVNRRLDDALPPVHRSHRLGAGHRRAAAGLNLLRHHLRNGLVKSAAVHIHPRVNHDHPGPFLGHQLGNAPPHAPAGAGNDGGFPLQIVRHISCFLKQRTG